MVRNKFIENINIYYLRVTLYPLPSDFITFGRDNLLKHTESEVRALAKKLPKEVVREREK